MTTSSPHHTSDAKPAGRGTSRAQVARWGAAAIVVLVVAHVLDGPARSVLPDARAESRDWHRLARVMGYVPTWALAAAALVLNDRSRHRDARGRWLLRGAYVLGAAAAGGAAAEVGKLLVRRLRPGAEMVYEFRPFAEDLWSTSGIGMPSSHTAVAFAAAGALTRLFPASTVVWVLLAAACGWTRLLDDAHYLSDVVAGAMLGWLMAQAVALLGPRQGQGASGAEGGA